MGLLRRSRSKGARLVDRYRGDVLVGPWLDARSTAECAEIVETLDAALAGGQGTAGPALIAHYDHMIALPHGTDAKRREWVLVTMLGTAFREDLRGDADRLIPGFEERFYTEVDHIAIEWAGQSDTRPDLTPGYRAVASEAVMGAAAAINSLLRDPITEASPLVEKLATAANKSERENLRGAIAATAWFFGFQLHLSTEVTMAERIPKLYQALTPDDEVARRLPQDTALQLGAARARYAETSGADSEYETEFARWVSLGLGLDPAQASKSAHLDSGPLIDACNRFLDAVSANVRARVEG